MWTARCSWLFSAPSFNSPSGMEVSWASRCWICTRRRIGRTDTTTNLNEFRDARRGQSRSRRVRRLESSISRSPRTDLPCASPIRRINVAQQSTDTLTLTKTVNPANSCGSHTHRERETFSSGRKLGYVRGRTQFVHQSVHACYHEDST